jgi:hypothetical protein
MRALLGVVFVVSVLVASSAQALCLARCSCPRFSAWAVEGVVQRNATDGGSSNVSSPFVLQVTEVFAFNSTVPPAVGDVLDVPEATEAGERLLLLSSGDVVFPIIDGGVQCQADRFPKPVFVEALRTGTCRALLADAGIPENPECNDVRFCGCSGWPASTSLGLLTLAALLRLRRRPS